MIEWYILDGREVKPVTGYMDYHRWRESLDPHSGPRLSLRIAVDDLNGVHVSTVFLGLDHSWGSGPPLVFETMTFDGRPAELRTCDGYQWRYSSLDDAEAGHRAVVAAIRHGRELPECRRRNGGAVGLASVMRQSWLSRIWHTDWPVAKWVKR